MNKDELMTIQEIEQLLRDWDVLEGRFGPLSRGEKTQVEVLESHLEALDQLEKAREEVWKMRLILESVYDKSLKKIQVIGLNDKCGDYSLIEECAICGKKSSHLFKSGEKVLNYHNKNCPLVKIEAFLAEGEEK